MKSDWINLILWRQLNHHNIYASNLHYKLDIITINIMQGDQNNTNSTYIFYTRKEAKANNVLPYSIVNSYKGKPAFLLI